MAKETIKWHTAFVEALQLELEQYQDILEFKPEYQLNDEPLIMDVLVVKKVKDVVIAKNIGAIFKSDNVVEYKSPETTYRWRTSTKYMGMRVSTPR
jgi:hypothetical protein